MMDCVPNRTKGRHHCLVEPDVQKRVLRNRYDRHPSHWELASWLICWQLHKTWKQSFHSIGLDQLVLIAVVGTERGATTERWQEGFDALIQSYTGTYYIILHHTTSYYVILCIQIGASMVRSPVVCLFVGVAILHGAEVAKSVWRSVAGTCWRLDGVRNWQCWVVQLTTGWWWPPTWEPQLERTWKGYTSAMVRMTKRTVLVTIVGFIDRYFTSVMSLVVHDIGYRLVLVVWW